jgi:hypothetical protein
MYNDRFFLVGSAPVLSDVSLLVLQPSATMRLYLRQNEELQPLVCLKVSRDVPFASADEPEIQDGYEDMNDNWTFALGAGLRTFLNDRLSLGGEAVLRGVLHQVDGEDAEFGGSGGLDVFLQYHP